MKKEVYSLRKCGKLLAPAVLGTALLISAPASADEVTSVETTDTTIMLDNTSANQGGESLSQTTNNMERAKQEDASDLVKEWGQPTIEDGKLVEATSEIPTKSQPFDLVEDIPQSSTEAEKKVQSGLDQAQSNVKAQEEKLAAFEKNVEDSKGKVAELEKAVQDQEALVQKASAGVPALDLETMKAGDFSSAAGEWLATHIRKYNVNGNAVTQRDWEMVDSTQHETIKIYPNGELRIGSYTPIHLKHAEGNKFHGVEQNPAAMSSYVFEEAENILNFTGGEVLAPTIRYQRSVTTPSLASEFARLAELREALAEAQLALNTSLLQVENAQAVLAASRKDLRIAEKQLEIANQERIIENTKTELAAQKEELRTLKNKYLTVIDFEAIAQGDFSSLAGEWMAEEGTSLVFSKDGLVTYGPFKVQASFDKDNLRLTLPLPKGGDVYHPTYLLFTFSNAALILSDDLGEKLYIRKTVLDNVEVFERIKSLESSIALLEENLYHSLEVLDNLKSELLELEKDTFISNQESVSNKIVKNGSVTTDRVVNLASKKLVSTDVKTLPNTGTESSALASLGGIGLLLTLGTVKAKRRK